MSIQKLANKFVTGAWLPNVKEYFKKTNEIIDSLNNTTIAYNTLNIYNAGQITQYDYKWYIANKITTPGPFNSSDWDFQSYVIYRATKTIEAAQVLTLNSVPVLFLPAIQDKFIRLINGRIGSTFVTTAYATFTTVQLQTDTASMPQFSIINFLQGTRTRDLQCKPFVTNPTASDTQLIISKPIYINVLTGDPTAGDSPITVYVDYIVID